LFYHLQISNLNQQIIKSLTRKAFLLKELSGGQYEDCIGSCEKYDKNNTIRYSRTEINLYFDCFVDKNEELAKNIISIFLLVNV